MLNIKDIRANANYFIDSLKKEILIVQKKL